ncbi:membrane protein [Salmonella enterica subsp. enterica]|nr:membrane protein [Salmonella enterica subsp. enterica]
MIQRHPYLFVIGTRFMYGFRVVGPLLIGASRLPPKIFLPLNIVGALNLGAAVYHAGISWRRGDRAMAARPRSASQARSLADSGHRPGGGRALVAEKTRQSGGPLNPDGIRMA